MKKNKHIGSSFEDYLKKTLTKEEIMEIEQEAQREVEKLREEKLEAVKLEAFLVERGLTESYPKKNIRIYFKPTYGNVYIHNVDVVEFDPKWFEEDPQRAEKVNNKYGPNILDMGNASSSWMWEPPVYIIYHLFVDWGFEHKDEELMALCELTKIEEMRIDIAKILWKSNLLIEKELS